MTEDEKPRRSAVGWLVLIGFLGSCCSAESVLMLNIHEPRDLIVPICLGILGMIMAMDGIRNLSE